MVRILHISALPIWPMKGKGGMPSLKETLEGHVREGIYIEVIIPQYHLFTNGNEKLSIPEGCQFKVHVAPCSWLPVLKSLRSLAYRICKKGALPYALRWTFNMSILVGLTCSLMLKAIRVYRTDFQPDIIYAHNQYAALTGFLLGKLWKIPNVTRLYGTFLAELMHKPLVALRYPTAAAGFLVPCSLLICANDGTRGDEVAEKLGVDGSRFRFWQNGIQPPSKPPKVTRDELAAKYEHKIRPESKWIVSCSRLSYWKRIDRMIKAFSMCRKKGIDCQLIIAGDGEQREYLEKLAVDCGVSDDVAFLGALPHDDIWALMNLTDIFMITNDVTNRCNPLFEAAWAGLPVVSVFDKSTSDLLEHRKNALLADKDDIEGLASNLAELCVNNKLAGKLRDGQKKLAAGFWTWEERMKVEVSEIKRLVSPPK